MSVTFGYTTAGTGGTTTLENTITGSEFTAPSQPSGSGGSLVIDKISAYYNPSASPFTTKCAVYTAAHALVSGSETAVVTGTTGANWRDFTYSAKPTLAQNTAYVLVAWTQSRSGTNVLSWDAGAANQGHTATATYGTWPASISPTHSTNKYSIYATGHFEYSLAGGVAVTTTVAAGLDYTRHAAVAGSVAVSTAVAAAIAYNRHFQIAGTVTVATAVAAVMEYAPGTGQHQIAGLVAVAGSVTASMAYNRHASLAGSVPVSSVPSAALGYNRHASFTGAVAVLATPTAALAYNRHATLAGAISVASAPAAALAYNRHPALAGSVSVSAVPTAALAYNRHALIVGSVALAATPAATGLTYNRHPAINGAITVASLPSGAMVYNRNASITGFVTLTALPEADFRYLPAAPLTTAPLKGNYAVRMKFRRR